MTDPEQWLSQGPVTWTGETARLGAGASVSVQMALAIAQEPEMIVKAVGLSFPSQMQLQLGATIENFDLPFLGVATNYKIAGDMHEPDIGGQFYTVSVKNVTDGIIEIFYVCVRHTLDEEGEPIPIDPTPGGPDEEEPPGWLEEAGCGDTITQPTGNDVGEWTNWLWNNQKEFFYCHLLRAVVQIYEIVDDFMRMVGWGFRWFFDVTVMAFEWVVEQVIPWLRSEFSNLSGATTVFIRDDSAGGGGSGLDECNSWDIPCFITNILLQFFADDGPLNNFVDEFTQLIESLLLPISTAIAGGIDLLYKIIYDAAQLLLQLIEGLAALFIFVTAMLLQFAQWVIIGIGAFIGAIIAAPPIIPAGWPDCNQNQCHGVCLLWWLLDSTIFSSGGTLFVPIMVSAMSVFLMIWVIKTIRINIIKAGANA